MQQADEARLGMGLQHVADLAGDPPFEVGGGAVRRVVAEEAVVVINRGYKVGAGEEISGIQVAENASCLGDLFRHLRFQFPASAARAD